MREYIYYKDSSPLQKLAEAYERSINSPSTGNISDVQFLFPDPHAGFEHIFGRTYLPV